MIQARWTSERRLIAQFVGKEAHFSTGRLRVSNSLRIAWEQQRLPGRDGFFDRGCDLTYYPVAAGFHDELHLHGFQDGEALTALQCITDLDLDEDQDSLMRSRNGHGSLLHGTLSARIAHSESDAGFSLASYAILSPDDEPLLLLPWNTLYMRDVLDNRKLAFPFTLDSKKEQYRER